MRLGAEKASGGRDGRDPDERYSNRNGDLSGLRHGARPTISPSNLLLRVTNSNWNDRFESKAVIRQTLLNHPVRAQQQRLRNIDADCFRGLEINHQLEPRRLLDW